MLYTKISVEIPDDELCDHCSYIRYSNEGSSANCSIFLEQLETNSEDQYIPCSECIKKRG